MEESIRKHEGEDTVIRVCGVEPESIVDGPGFRYVLFVQGCPHHCKGCHNPESWAPDAGFDMTVSEVFKEIQDKAVDFGGNLIFIARNVAIALALISFAIGLLMIATGSKKKEEGKERITGALIGIFLTGIVFSVLSVVFSIF